MDLTPKQQTSEAIRQAETILIMTGQHPSVDQVSAVIALTAILRKFGKKASAVVSDSLPQSVQQLLDVSLVERNMTGLRDFILKLDVTKAEVDKLRYEVVDGKLQIFVTPFKGGFAPSDVTFGYGESQFEYDLAIVLGVPTRARIDRIYEQNHDIFARIPVINLDFHRSNENYGAVNLIEPNASSLCEMLVALSESLQGGIIDAEIATALLMGIVGSTDRFTASHTTSKSLTVAAQMMAAGAKQQAVMRALYRDNAKNERADRAERGGERSGGDRTDRDRQGGERGHGQREQREPRQQQPVTTQVQSQHQPAQPQHQPAQPTPQPEQPATPRSEQPVTPPTTPVTQQPTQPMPDGGAVAPHSTDSQPRVDTQPRPAEPSKPTPTPDAPDDLRPFRGGEAELPIIDPSHIEFSQADPAQESAEAGPTAPRSATQPQTPPVPPVPSPMADFTAAAEQLAQRQREQDQARPERPE